MIQRISFIVFLLLILEQCSEDCNSNIFTCDSKKNIINGKWIINSSETIWINNELKSSTRSVYFDTLLFDISKNFGIYFHSLGFDTAFMYLELNCQKDSLNFSQDLLYHSFPKFWLDTTLYKVLVYEPNYLKFDRTLFYSDSNNIVTKEYRVYSLFKLK